MKHFINERHNIVTEALDGLLCTQPELARLDGYPSIKVVIRRDWDRSKVALISGGGSGHEPAHAGFVGRGMLTAAVCGEIFASPSVDAVLAAILAVTGPAGCLLLVKNYTGDRLNFGLAAEKARARGLHVEVVIVADDIALPESPQPRGVAGTLFVHKIAGHLAERGASLNEIKNAAETVAGSIVSLGISLSSCTIPGLPTEARMTQYEAELGLGIHGEPGVEKISLQPVHSMVELMTTRLLNAVPEGKLAVLLNNLGGVPPIEMSVIVHALLSGALRERIALLFGPASLMTSLDMKGFSISLLPLSLWQDALLSPVAPAAWGAGREVCAVNLAPVPEGVSTTSWSASPHQGNRDLLQRICEALIASKDELNGLDAKIGDGDTGSTFASAAEGIVARLDALPLAEPASLCVALSEILSTVMGGSSGVLLSIVTARIGAALSSGGGWPEAIQQGVERLQHYGGAKEGDRTMLDALIPAARALQDGRGWAAAADEAARGAARTATMTKARAGRASYVNEAALRGVCDPGAVAVAKVFRVIAPE